MRTPPLLQMDMDDRRRQLGMTNDDLARRSGVSRRTVIRVLDNCRSGNFASVERIAGALGMSIHLEVTQEAESVRRNQASKKAKRMVAMIQGTMGLEAQAVSRDAEESLHQQTVRELMKSKRRLWAE